MNDIVRTIDGASQAQQWYMDTSVGPDTTVPQIINGVAEGLNIGGQAYETYKREEERAAREKGKITDYSPIFESAERLNTVLASSDKDDSWKQDQVLQESKRLGAMGFSPSTIFEGFKNSGLEPFMTDIKEYNEDRVALNNREDIFREKAMLMYPNASSVQEAQELYYNKLVDDSMIDAQGKRIAIAKTPEEKRVQFQTAVSAIDSIVSDSFRQNFEALGSQFNIDTVNQLSDNLKTALREKGYGNLADLRVDTITDAWRKVAEKNGKSIEEARDVSKNLIDNMAYRRTSQLWNVKVTGASGKETTVGDIFTISQVNQKMGEAFVADMGTSLSLAQSVIDGTRADPISIKSPVLPYIVGPNGSWSQNVAEMPEGPQKDVCLDATCRGVEAVLFYALPEGTPNSMLSVTPLAYTYATQGLKREDFTGTEEKELKLFNDSLDKYTSDLNKNYTTDIVLLNADGVASLKSVRDNPQGELQAYDKSDDEDFRRNVVRPISNMISAAEIRTGLSRKELVDMFNNRLLSNNKVVRSSYKYITGQQGMPSSSWLGSFSKAVEKNTMIPKQMFKNFANESQEAPVDIRNTTTEDWLVPTASGKIEGETQVSGFEFTPEEQKIVDRVKELSDKQYEMQYTSEDPDVKNDDRKLKEYFDNRKELDKAIDEYKSLISKKADKADWEENRDLVERRRDWVYARNAAASERVEELERAMSENPKDREIREKYKEAVKDFWFTDRLKRAFDKEYKKYSE